MWSDCSLQRPKDSCRHDIFRHRRYWAHSPSILRNPCSRGNSKIHKGPLDRCDHPSRRPLSDKGSIVQNTRWTEWEPWGWSWLVEGWLRSLPPPKAFCKLLLHCPRCLGRRCRSRLCLGSTDSIQIRNICLLCTTLDSDVCYPFLPGVPHNHSHSTGFQTRHEPLAGWARESNLKATDCNASSFQLI